VRWRASASSQRIGQAAVVLAFPLIYYAVIGSGQTVFARYVLPLVPFLCLLAAVTVVWRATEPSRDSTLRSLDVAEHSCTMNRTGFLFRSAGFEPSAGPDRSLKCSDGGDSE